MQDNWEGAYELVEERYILPGSDKIVFHALYKVK